MRAGGAYERAHELSIGLSTKQVLVYYIIDAESDIEASHGARWAQRTKRCLKAELKRADVTDEELARRLSELGLQETRASVSNKISRGGFPDAFFVAVLKAIGVQQMKLEDI